MSQDLTLYFFPFSYYSLKVVFALKEKGIPFKEQIVNIQANEQQQEWYLKINPRGEVPVLQHGERFISDSEAIIDYIDARWQQGPRLVPGVRTGLGKEVQALRQTLHNIPIDHITFGIIANSQFCTGQPRFPKLIIGRAAAEKRLRGMVDGMRAMKQKVPKELREELSVKIKKSEERLATVLNENAIAAILDDLEKVFDTIETLLDNSKNDQTGSYEYWLLGNALMAPDITAAILMYRLYFLGIDNRYFSDTKRPIVKEYFTRLCERPAMKSVIETSDSTARYLAKVAALKFAKVGMIVGVVVLGALGARALYNGSGDFKKL